MLSSHYSIKKEKRKKKNNDNNVSSPYRTIILENDRNLLIYLDFEVLYGRTGIVVGKFAKKETIRIFDAFQALRSIEINRTGTKYRSTQRTTKDTIYPNRKFLGSSRSLAGW